jgi:hypothetical protein
MGARMTNPTVKHYPASTIGSAEREVESIYKCGDEWRAGLPNTDDRNPKSEI